MTRTAIFTRLRRLEADALPGRYPTQEPTMPKTTASDATDYEPVAPATIWATINGASTRVPDGGRQLIGGWSEDKDRPRATEYTRADLVADATPLALLAAHNRFMSGAAITADEKARADRVATAAAFAVAAYEKALDQDHGAHCIARAFLTALVDPMSADLDYLRRDPSAAAAIRTRNSTEGA